MVAAVVVEVAVGMMTEMKVDHDVMNVDQEAEAGHHMAAKKGNEVSALEGIAREVELILAAQLDVTEEVITAEVLAEADPENFIKQDHRTDEKLPLHRHPCCY